MNWLLDLFNLPPLKFVDDGWWEDAKIGHFLLHAAVAYYYTRCGMWHGGLFWTLTFGTMYEMYDSARGVGFSMKDWWVNLLGWAAGTAVGLLV